MTDERPYPEGWDWGWLASDRDGHLALFVTGGQGPVPALALDLAYPEDCEQRLNALAKRCDARRINDPVARGEARQLFMPPTDTFMELAERGVFAYDWSDVHREGGGACIDAYELYAAPYRPITATELPDDLAAVARSVRFTALSFAESWLVDVRGHLICREPQR